MQPHKIGQKGKIPCDRACRHLHHTEDTIAFYTRHIQDISYFEYHPYASGMGFLSCTPTLSIRTHITSNRGVSQGNLRRTRFNTLGM